MTLVIKARPVVEDKGTRFNDPINASVRVRMEKELEGHRAKLSYEDIQHAVKRRFQAARTIYLQQNRDETQKTAVKNKKKMTSRWHHKTKSRSKVLPLMTGWSEAKKERVKSILLDEFISSDESDVEGEQNGKARLKTARKLTWESQRLRKYKNEFDTAYLKTLSKAAKKTFCIPTRNDAVRSSRTPQENAPEWAISSD
ncbi:unnamed protein product [Owenia fusiformis]|uniref:Uncharacterized protein n=1 Tax=Owenia fusiformis TaxID=6347 RepID=A0A8S4NBH9_OWEFU|nr:unnamed protein product [Owenia fusiformis]